MTNYSQVYICTVRLGSSVAAARMTVAIFYSFGKLVGLLLPRCLFVGASRITVATLQEVGTSRITVATFMRVGTLGLLLPLCG